MIENANFDFSKSFSANTEHNVIALRCEEKIRSFILDTDYDSSLLLRAVAHQLLIYVSSFILRHENMNHEISTQGFPYLPGGYWQRQNLIKFDEKRYEPVFSYSPQQKCFVENTASFKVFFPLRIFNKFLTFINVFWLNLKKNQKINSNLKRNYISGQRVLRYCLKVLAVEIGILKKDESIFVDNFIAYVDSYVNFFCAPTASALNSGTLCKIISSSRAFAYRCEKLPVIVEDHGDFSILLHDEPVARLSELGLCTIFKTYGDPEWIREILSSQKLLISKPKIRQIRNNLKSHRNCEIPENNNSVSEGKKLLYIPTAFSSYYRYLPYRDYSDDFYLAWQRLLLRKLSELGHKLDYKLHPKNKINLFDGENTIITKSLNSLNFEEYDAIVLDFVSTAFTQAIDSPIPVWFFDIGLRKMQPHFYEHFLTRGIKPIDFDSDISPQIEQICKVYENEDKIYRVRLR